MSTRARRHSAANTTAMETCEIAHDHQNQFPAMPCSATSPATTSGVSAANVVAAMDVPSHHHGSVRSATK